MDMTGRYASRLRQFYGGRKLVLTGAPLAMLRGTSRMVRSLGADRPFLLAAGVGTGPLPTEEEGERFVLQLSAPDVVTETRAIMSLLADLPAGALAALDRYDPDREALVLSPPANELRTIAGRRVYAPRHPSWRRLEDKTRIDELWDAHGIRRPPSLVVPATGEALRAAARRMDRGLGTVWAGDTSEGVNGGAIYVRWVRDDRDAAEAVSFLSTHCDRARVVPFIEGVPCSIHGLVLPDGVAALRRLQPPGVRRRRHLLGPAGGRPGGDAPGGRRGRRRPARPGGLSRGVHRRRRPQRGGVPAHRAEHPLRRRPDDYGRRARGPAAVAAQPRGGQGRAARHRVGGAGGRRSGGRGPAPLGRRLDGHPPGAGDQPAAAGRVQPRRLPVHPSRRAAGGDAVGRAVERGRVGSPGARPRPHRGGAAGRSAGRGRLRARRCSAGHLDRPPVTRALRALNRRLGRIRGCDRSAGPPGRFLSGRCVTLRGAKHPPVVPIGGS